jgi:pullulanase
MTRKLINDSLKYWMDTFNICGFRFDLMGLIDLDSMNYFANNVISNYDKAVIYGEGWHMKSLLKNNEKGSMNNANRMPNIAYFNDYFRDNIRTKDRTFKGFIDGKNYNIKNTYNCLLGSNHMFKGSYQSLNYVECHDNYTLFDQLRVNKVDNENIYDLHVLGTSLVIISLGVPFLHCGQELFRSKYLVENSYNSLDIINMIDYKRMEEYSWYINLVRDLISIRKEYIAFRRNNSDNVTILNREQDSHNIVLKYHEDKYNLYCIIKNDYVLFDYTFDNQVECIFNGLKKDNMKVRNVLLSKPGVYIYKENLNE